MINPAEDIVSIWIQEVKNHFIMSNIVVPKSRGGRGKEIDLLSTKDKKYFWIEVSVSPNPRLPSKSERFNKLTKNALDKFADEKSTYLNKRFPGKLFQKWFVYSPKLFGRKSDERDRYCNALKQRGIYPIGFDDVLHELLEKLNYMGYDATRNYLFLLRKFWDK
ncbi:MAG: hypothetical protein Q8Q94_03330 [bacterium]|nr:hypothetical protein [bacterium]MDZ4286230.1 hypothetical protein [Candidatus Sungbacteria bacterium]